MPQTLRLTVVAGEFPYPPNHGGRADVWSRLQALAERGVRIQLICWYSPLWGGAPAPEHLQAVRAVVADLIVLPIPLGPAALLRRLALLPWWPSHVASRAPTRHQWRELLPRVRRFGPQAIWQDNLWPGVAAERLAHALGVPRWMRSHNVEFRYMAHQRRLARGLSERLRLWITCLGIERYELHNLRCAQTVFDISVDDMAYWRTRGVSGGQWLPPIVKVPPPEQGADSAAVLPEGSALYVGNLHTPNNVQGLLWFFDQVWPRVLQHHAGARLTVAGSNPHPDIVAAVRAATGVTLLPNPPEVWPLYRQARVLINPILAGSGVNIKTTEMLQVGCPIVSTGIGVGGLPPQVRQAVRVADEPEDFAQALAAALQGQWRQDPAVADAARQPFLPQALDHVVAALQALPPSSATIRPA